MRLATPGVMRLRLLARCTGGVVLAAVAADTAGAHGFGQRYDLPVPLGLWIAGAAAVVAFSFVAIGLFMRWRPSAARYPRLNLLRWPLGRLVAARRTRLVAQILSLALLLVNVAAGLFGDQTPTRNLAPTAIWIVWWVGFAYLSALVGNIWAVINPWAAAFAWVEAAARRCPGAPRPTLGLRWPARLGAWPASALFAAFAWTELVFSGRTIPAQLGLLVIFYSVVTWAAMFLVGRTAWLQNGDPFAVAFGILARFAPMEIRTGARLCPCPGGEGGDGGENCMNCSDCFDRAPPAEREWNLRPVGVGLLRTSDITPSMVVFVLLMLSAVTFDGFTATPLWATVENALYHALPGPGATRLAVIGTAGLALFAVAFIVVYRFFAWWMAVAAGGELAAATTARLFVLSLVPIAIAYHLAHDFTYLLIQGQLIIRLGSDPLGVGWNLLGTAHYRPDIGVVGARFAWYSAVIAIVLGHVIAVAVAHIVALREYATRRAALRSQLPMLVLMVGYTMVSLWIIAQPIVEARPDAAVAPASFIGAADDARDLARSLARRRMRHESLGAGCDPRGRRVSARRGGANRRAPDGPGQPLCARRGLLAAARGGKRTAPGDRGGNRHRRRRRSDAGQSAVASGAAGWQGLLAAGLDPA